jgi:hypothetical protein
MGTTHKASTGTSVLLLGKVRAVRLCRGCGQGGDEGRKRRRRIAKRRRRRRRRRRRTG